MNRFDPMNERVKRALRFGTVFIVGLLGGVMLKTALLNRQPVSTPQASELRLGLYKFINPLLECEIANKNEFVKMESLEDQLHQTIDDAVAKKSANEVSVYFRGMNSGKWLGVNEDVKYPAASLMKIPFMIAYFKALETKPDLFSKTIVFDGGPNLNDKEQIKPAQSIEAGESYTVEELLRRMIVYSGNNSTALLVKNIDPSVINGVLTDLHVAVERDQEHDAFISARDYSYFFRVLYNSTYLTRDSSERALTLLTQTEFKDGLVAGVPRDVAVAHKFGEYGLVDANQAQTGSGLHDCGIVYHPTHPYFLCVMTQGQNLQSLEGVIQTISRLVYDSVDKELPKKGSATTGTK